MSRSHGKFCWYELMTTDPEAAQAFYRDVIGWHAHDAGMPDRTYSILSAATTPMGGLMELPAEARAAGVRPSWVGYVAVDDVDQAGRRVEKAGGKIHRAPEDIPAVGRFAVVADPQGGPFVLFKALPAQPTAQPATQPPGPGAEGHVGWHELRTHDVDKAFNFYSTLFGWSRAQALDLGSMGTYQMFGVGGPPIGGMLSRVDADHEPPWLYYFNVQAIDAAVERVREGAGEVIDGPHEVPGGSWVAQCLDPQGAMFALVAPGR